MARARGGSEGDERFERHLSRAVAPMRPRDAASYIEGQIGIAEIRSEIDETPTSDKDRAYRTNDAIWQDIISEKIRANTVIHLEEFVLTEWIPWSPGTFHTRAAADARREAWDYRIPDEIIREAQRGMQPLPNALPFNFHGIVPSSRDTIVFDPRGKLSMIQGGVGCVRLQPVDLRAREFWLIGATSSLVAHEGIVVAVNSDQYDEIIGDISSGGLQCNKITGRLRFARDLEHLDFRSGIPKLYLEAENIDRKPMTWLKRRTKPSCLVCAAAAFESSYEGSSKLYATYANFNSDSKSSLNGAVEWMEEEYVRGMFRGTVVADFDEQSTRFSGAVFGLGKVMRDGIHLPDAAKLVLSVSDDRAMKRITSAIERMKSLTIERVGIMTMKTVTIGDNNTINAPITIADLIQGSFNAIKQSDEDSATKDLLEKLVRTVADIGPKIPEADAKSLARDADDVVKEATASEPRKEVCTSLLQRITKAAKAMGAVAAPLAAVAVPLIKLYSGAE
jgi:hypothetical protein